MTSRFCFSERSLPWVNSASDRFEVDVVSDVLPCIPSKIIINANGRITKISLNIADQLNVLSQFTEAQLRELTKENGYVENKRVSEAKGNFFEIKHEPHVVAIDVQKDLKLPSVPLPCYVNLLVTVEKSCVCEVLIPHVNVVWLL